MKIAIFGNTLYAGVMSALLSESGHFVYWCSHINPNENGQQYSFHDENVSRLLEKQLSSGFLIYRDLDSIPLDIDAYLFSFNHLLKFISININKNDTDIISSILK